MKLARCLGCVLVLAGVLACGDDEPSQHAAKRRDASVSERDARAPDAEPPSATALDGGEAAPRDAEPRPAVDAATATEPGRTITIRFRAVVGAERFDCARRYDIPGLGRIEPRDFKFYVQDVALLDRSGREVPVKLADQPPGQAPEVALLDFETGADYCGAGSPWTNTQLVGTVPEGAYRGIVFSNGVPEALNHADPSTFPPPLQDFSMYWSWFQGFKFFVVDGFGVADRDGIGVADDRALDEDAGTGLAGSSAVLHVGSVGCQVIDGSKFACSVPNRNRIRLSDFDPDAHTIVADFAAVFAGARPPTDTFCHGGRASCARVYDNLGLKLSTGLPSDTQKVYRIE